MPWVHRVVLLDSYDLNCIDTVESDGTTEEAYDYLAKHNPNELRVRGTVDWKARKLRFWCVVCAPKCLSFGVHHADMRSLFHACIHRPGWKVERCGLCLLMVAFVLHSWHVK